MKKAIEILFLLMFCLLSGIKSFCQNVNRPDIILDEFILRIAATQQDDTNYEDLYEALLQFYLKPIDINQANEAELRNLFILSEIQINDFLNHRTKYGKLISLYELQTIPNFDQNTIELLLPFVKLSPQLSLNDIKGIYRRSTDHFFVVRTERTLEKAQGYKDSSFLGSPNKLYARYRLQHPKDFSLGFIIEKDQGEPNWLDYGTLHFQIQHKGKVKNAIIGDYQLQFGQGLILSGGYAAGKGGETIYTTRRSDLGIRPNNSVIEGGFLRGAASTFEIGKIDFTAFVSANKRDASLNTDSDNEDQIFSSILASGLHRTKNEIAKKGVLNEKDIGANLKWNFKNGHLGFTAIYNLFGNRLERTPRTYTEFEFKGKQNTVFGSNFSYSWQNFNFFGEAGRSSSGGIGAVGGFVASLSPKIEWAVNFRNYDKNFHSFYGNSFAESSRNINERGMYTGLKFTPKKGVVFSAFYDKFKFPWLRYLVDASSEGHDYLFRFALKKSKAWSFYSQYHFEQKQKNLPNNKTPTDFLVNTKRGNLLAQLEYKHSTKLLSQTRIQYNSFQYETLNRSNGYAIIQDIEGNMGKLQLKTRFAYFNTQSYESRIYAYENDVLYTVSFPAYYGKGTRVYLVAKYDINFKLDFWIKIARTSLKDADQISSGVNKIDAPHKTDIKLQLRYSF